ncbi:hypothetical protein PAI11_18570 [Patulibacter medicamentivorans]|uniref:Uncharacterized protein n=1 Tax=Patulibacter medicamentivorans TaxID=1097667 RepID=H0E4X2_9ACTN|nr:hypothetical protein PAI11_18570 [Patulibacter medicamentivorans]
MLGSTQTSAARGRRARCGSWTAAAAPPATRPVTDSAWKRETSRPLPSHSGTLIAFQPALRPASRSAASSRSSTSLR